MSAFGIAGGLESQARSLKKLLVRLLIFVDADTEHDDAFFSHLLRELIQRGHFLDAGRAPGRPEIENQQLPTEIFRADTLASISGDRKRRRRITLVDDPLLERVPDSVEETLQKAMPRQPNRTRSVVEPFIYPDFSERFGPLILSALRAASNC